jgi:hypothetical protein
VRLPSTWVLETFPSHLASSLPRGCRLLSHSPGSDPGLPGPGAAGRILPHKTGLELSHGPVSTAYRFGRREIGHVHHNGVADLTFPREIHDELISDGRAKPHGAGFPGVVSYHIREPEDVPGAVELFRMSYDRATTAAKRRQRG